MTEKSKDQKQKPEETPRNPSEEERIYQALENARQIVKPIVKREMEGEVINEELLNLRLKG